jgi:hypothetical protein
VIISLHRADGAPIFKGDAMQLIAWFVESHRLKLPAVHPGEQINVQAMVERTDNTTAVLSEPLRARRVN